MPRLPAALPGTGALVAGACVLQLLVAGTAVALGQGADDEVVAVVADDGTRTTSPVPEPSGAAAEVVVPVAGLVPPTAAVPALPSAQGGGSALGLQSIGVGTVDAVAGALPPVAGLQVPSAVVRSATGLSPAQVAALRDAPGVVGVTVVAAGDVAVDGLPTRVLGVDPGFRALTPEVTAGADALWQLVAGGDLALSYAAAEARGLELGATPGVAPAAGQPLPLRVGGVATLGLPGVDGLVSPEVGTALGLAPAGEAWVVAPDVNRLTRVLEGALGRAAGPDAEVVVLGADTAGSGLPVAPAPAGRPTTYMELYRASAPRCPGLSWTVLAAIGQIESGHGRNMGPSSAGALGPMQFMPATWASYAMDGDGDGRSDVMNPYDAVPAAANYLCVAGAGRSGGLYSAVFAYNHADWYVRKVLTLAEAYAAQG